MSKRFVTIWFPYLLTDWYAVRRPVLRNMPFVLVAPDHGRIVIRAANALAQAQGIDRGMVLADARALIPSLQTLDEKPELTGKLLTRLAEWCIRYTPVVAIDLPDGLILEATGCTHLWGSERDYLKDIVKRLKTLGYTVRLSMADTIGTAWAVARFGKKSVLIETGEQANAVLNLPPAGLRLEADILLRLQKLGLRKISDFISMPRSALRRRFGQQLLMRLDQALGYEEEPIVSVQPIPVYQERLPCLDTIVTRTGIEMALQTLLETVCKRLQQEGKGLRSAIFKGYRADGQIVSMEIGTNRATHNTIHLFKLFEIKIDTLEPGPGIELFTLEAAKTEEVSARQEKLWETIGGLHDTNLSELLDRVAGKFGNGHIHRYLPDEHYWPERSIKSASSLTEELITKWKADRPRPAQLLAIPERIDVTAPVPDYPPMLFRHKGKLHKIIRADGPERIEQEWWLQQGEHRDYYHVEDEQGYRYWLFRQGHYTGNHSSQWFLHGFFA